MALEQAEKVWFHDATLVGIQASVSGATLEVEDARTTNDRPCSVLVSLEQVAVIQADGELVDHFVMEAEDAEILTLDLRDDGISMVLEWNDWNPPHHFVRSYEIKAEDVRVIAMD